MANLITEIFDRQAVIDNLNQLGELINSSLNAIVSAAPKLQSPIDYMTALKSVDEIEKESIKTAEAKKKALSDLDKLYQQADKAIQQYDNLADAEFQTQTKLVSQYKEMTKEQKQLLEIERTRQQTMQNSNKLLTQEAKTEAELRMQTQQLIKASQSLRLTNADENKVREQLIQKINANKEALKGMTNEVSKQKDNIGNYKSALEGVASGELTVKEAIKALTIEMVQLEAKRSAGVKLSAEETKRYAEVSQELGKLKDVQGDVSAQTNILAQDYLGLKVSLEGLKLGANVLAAVQGATAMLGVENEKLVESLQKLQAVQAFANSVSQITEQLNKSNLLAQGLQVVKTKLLTAATGEQTKAQLALNAAKLGFIGLAAGAVAGLTIWIAKMASAKNETADLNKELNKQAVDAVAPLVQKVNDLKDKWSALGGDLEAQKKFLEDNKTELEGMGLALNDVNAAEKFFSGQTKEFIQAQINRAKADAARSKMTEIIKQQMESQLEFERRYIKNQKTMWESIVDGYQSAQNGALTYRAFVAKMHLEEQKANEEQIKSLADMATNFDNVANSLLENIPLHNDNANAINKERESIEEELTIEERLYLLRKKINEEREKQELPTIEKVTAKIQEQIPEYEAWERQLQKALKVYAYDYAKAITNASNAEEEARIKRENDIKTTEAHIFVLEKQLATLQEGTPEWYTTATALEEYRKKLNDLTDTEKAQAEAMAKLKAERKEATDAMVENIGSAFDAINGYYEHQQEVTDEWYNNEKERIEASVVDEETRERRLAQLDAEKTKRDKETAKKQAEIKRRQAIFQNAVDAAAAMSKAVASVGELLATSATGDPYTAIARYIAAIAAGVSAVTTITTLISRLLNIPAYEKGGLAEADKPFIAGEKGREIGFGQRTGKVYDFASPAIYKAPEPIAIKTASETNRIINNEYNKDVTLHNEVVVQVIDNKRIEKFFKI